MSSDDLFDEGTLPRLEKMVGQSTLDEVVDLYLENSPKRIEVVRKGLDAGDLASAAHALHDIKSSAGMVGATGLQRLARTMEQLAREADTDGLRERLERLQAASEQAESWLAVARLRSEG